MTRAGSAHPGTPKKAVPQQGSFAWLITDFVHRVPGAAHAVVVSADGLLLAASRGLPKDRADQLAAVASGSTSLARGAAQVFEGGPVAQTVVEMANGFCPDVDFRWVPSGRARALPTATSGVVYEMTLLVDRVGKQMTPELRPSCRVRVGESPLRQPDNARHEMTRAT